MSWPEINLCTCRLAVWRRVRKERGSAEEMGDGSMRKEEQGFLSSFT